MNVAAENKPGTKGISLQTVEAKQMQCMNLKVRYFMPEYINIRQSQVTIWDCWTVASSLTYIVNYFEFNEWNHRDLAPMITRSVILEPPLPPALKNTFWSSCRFSASWKSIHWEWSCFMQADRQT
jgi:hypothetical protein